MDYIDDSEAEEYLGKVVLLGVTYLDHEGKLLEQKQWAGTIVTFSKVEGITIKIRNSEELCGLPPFRKGIRKAPHGIYRLRTAGEEIIDPDYFATWTCVSPSLEKTGA